MKAQCPHCRFEGNIRDDLIPEGGRTIACPKCKKTFFVRKSGGAAGAPPVQERAAESPRPTAGPPPPARRARAGTNPFLIFIVAVLFLVLGFYAGYEYRGFMGGKDTPPSTIEKTKRAPKKSPPGTGPKHDRLPVMTPMGTPEGSGPPGDTGRTRESESETSFTVDTLLGILSTMPKGQARNFCRKNNTAEVTGNGTLREIKKTSPDNGIIGVYSVSVEHTTGTLVVVNAKMTQDYLSNFTVGNGVSFNGTLMDYNDSGSQKTIYLDDGMIIVK